LNLEKESGQYAVHALIGPGFGEFYGETNKSQQLAIYRKISTDLGLPSVKAAAQAEENLRAWENANPSKLAKEQVRGFFGATNVANGKLKKKTGVHLVPAVRDASVDAGDARNSPIIAILTDIARQTLQNKKEISEFINDVEIEFRKLSDPASIPELSNISSELTRNLQQMYKESELIAEWKSEDQIRFNFPVPRIIVEHEGITTDLSRVGHGLQRAALFAIVRWLAETKSVANPEDGKEFASAASDIIVLLEEPEIYQHPCKQVSIYEVLRDITEGFNKNTGIRIQIVYSTHSEKFIRMSDFHIARILSKEHNGDLILNKTSSLTLEDCSKGMAAFFDPPREPMKVAAFGSKLHIFTREVCEGFFARKVILVEGATDKAIIEACYLSISRNPYAEGLVVIGVDGKTKLDKPAYIFKSLGLPVYVIFDNDREKNGAKPDSNIMLQKICGVERPLEWPHCVEERFAAIDGNLEKYLKSRMEQHYETVFQQVAYSYGLEVSDIAKTPAAISSVFTIAKDKGVSFPTFDAVIQRVDAL
jgi:predicted ATP-dependent endonuclease of OLD family